MPAAPARSVTVRVPAKINLYLQVGPRRADGYHELATVFHAVDLCDEVTVSGSDGLQVRVSGRGADDLPTGPDNLAWRAADLLAERAGVDPSVLIEIDKAIPVSGGMAGGSADAAATLLACAALWRTGSSRAELAELAAELGSDVAFALTGGTAVGTGRGELLSPALTAGQLHWVLAVADAGISTAAAYAEFDRRRPAPASPTVPAEVLEALRTADADALAPTLRNDLQPVALDLVPALEQTLAAGTTLGALAAIVCGSGPTCALLCGSAAAARRVAARLPAQGVCAAAHAVTGPAPGAHVVDD